MHEHGTNTPGRRLAAAPTRILARFQPETVNTDRAFCPIGDSADAEDRSESAGNTSVWALESSGTPVESNLRFDS